MEEKNLSKAFREAIKETVAPRDDSSITVVNIDAEMVQRVTALEQRVDRIVNAIDKSKSVRNL